MANPNHSGLVLARFNIPTISKSPTTNINGVSLTKARNVFAAIIFWIICYAMSKYSYNLEQKYKTDR